MNEKEFLKKIAELAKCPVDQINDATPVHPAEWDSYELLELIAAIDESFGVTVPADQLKACNTVGDMRQLVAAAPVP